MKEEVNKTQHDEQVSESNTTLATLDCPNCGVPIPYVAGTTNCLLCPTCRSESQPSDEGAALVRMHSMMQVKTTTFALGRVARIPEVALDELFDDYNLPEKSKKSASAEPVREYLIVGILCFKEVGENHSWTEYLLHSQSHGFLSLIEEVDGWFITQLLDKAPVKKRGNLIFCEKIWRGYDTYQSKITYAIGAFNWHVSVTDNLKFTDYRKKKAFITKQQREKLFVYQLAVKTTRKQVFGWFYEPIKLTQSELVEALYAQFDANEISHEEFFERLWEISPPLHTTHTQNEYIAPIKKYRGYEDEGDYEVLDSKLGKIAIYTFFILIIGVGSCSDNSSYYSSGGRSGFSSYGSHK